MPPAAVREAVCGLIRCPGNGAKLPLTQEMGIILEDIPQGTKWKKKL